MLLTICRLIFIVTLVIIWLAANFPKNQIFMMAKEHIIYCLNNVEDPVWPINTLNCDNRYNIN